MSNVHRFLSLTPAVQRRYVRAFLIVAGVRIGLSIVPFSRFQALLVRFTPSSGRRSAAPTRAQLAHEVRVVSCVVPSATCLTQAIAGQILLGHYGYPAVVHFGVAKDEGEGAFQAHAWLESDGRVVIGESEQLYVPLARLGDTARM